MENDNLKIVENKKLIEELQNDLQTKSKEINDKNLNNDTIKKDLSKEKEKIESLQEQISSLQNLITKNKTKHDELKKKNRISRTRKRKKNR
jgi:chromosome segregation ATPase